MLVGYGKNLAFCRKEVRMVAEKIVGPEASYLRRLGALSATLCGIAALLGLALVALQPSADNVVALLVCAGVSGAGVALARAN